MGKIVARIAWVGLFFCLFSAISGILAASPFDQKPVKAVIQPQSQPAKTTIGKPPPGQLPSTAPATTTVNFSKTSRNFLARTRAAVISAWRRLCSLFGVKAKKADPSPLPAPTAGESESYVFPEASESPRRILGDSFEGPMPAVPLSLPNEKPQTVLEKEFGIAVSCAPGFQWEPGQLKDLVDTLRTLPKNFVGSTSSFHKGAEVPGHPGIMAYVVTATGPQRIHFVAEKAFEKSNQKGILVHEMTHCFQNHNPKVVVQWQKLFWPGPKPKSVTGYGNSNALEDMAESVRAYWANGPLLKNIQPQRYEFIRTQIMSGREF